MKRTQASRGQTPRHRSTRLRRANGVVPSPTSLGAELGVLTIWQGEWGPLRGKWGLSPPFFLNFSLFSLPLSFQIPFSYMYDSCSFLSLSPPPLWFRPLSLPHPLSALGSVEMPALPHQRCQKWGHNFWMRTWATPPRLPPPAPPGGFITSYAAHPKPIESLGGRECLTQISTSEGIFCYFRELLTGLWD